MGHSAKITRGGNKRRVNQARQAAKMKAQGSKAHTTSTLEVAAAKKVLKQRAQALSEQLKSSKQNGSNSNNNNGNKNNTAVVVRMAPKPKKN